MIELANFIDKTKWWCGGECPQPHIEVAISYYEHAIKYVFVPPLCGTYEVSLI